MQDKTLGYALLSIGILVMVFGMIQMALLVTRVVKPYPTFSFTQIFQNKSDLPVADLQNILQKAQGGSAGEAAAQTAAISALNPDVANDVLNFAVYFFFMSFLASIGHKIATLGVKLIRPAVLKMTPRDVENAMPSSFVNQPSPVAAQEMASQTKTSQF